MPPSSRSKATTDHEEIQRWAEARGGRPAAVKGTARGKRDVGMIRIDFPGYTGEGKLQPISWDQWFDKFDKSGLALIMQERTAKGQKSNFNKLVARETIESAKSAPRSRARRTSGTTKTTSASSKSRATKAASSRAAKAASSRAAKGAAKGSAKRASRRTKR